MRNHKTAFPRITQLLGLLGLLALAASWITPNKTYPWLSAWNEATAALGLLLLALTTLGRRAHARPALNLPLIALALLGLAGAWWQWSYGLLLWAGDAWLITLSLGLFALSLPIGFTLVREEDEGARWQDALLCTMLAAGLVSAGLVLMQWLWASPYAVFVQEYSGDNRPYANLGQPNHANTLFFLALCCALQLQRGRVIGRTGTLLAAALLTLAMAVTQSRTGILQLVLLALWSLWLARSGPEHRTWRWGLLALALCALWWLAMPWLSDALHLPTRARDVGVEITGSDARLAVWRGFFDAALQRPWVGWGWLQSGAAQEQFAACHPGIGVFFSYPHLLPLDLAVWLGFPLALVLCALLAWWLWPHLRARGAATGGYWTAAVLGFLVHAMLEYPQAYLYFLLPIGLMMGVIDARHPVHRTLRLPLAALRALWAALALLAALTLWDVVRASNAYTDIRFENARIGLQRQKVEIPRLLLLDHLEGFLHLSAVDLSRPPTDAQLASIHQTAQRFPFILSLLRQAWLLQAAGQGAESARVQQLYCDIYGAKHCSQGARQWHDWQQRYPQLQTPDFLGQVLPPRCQKSSF